MLLKIEILLTSKMFRSITSIFNINISTQFKTEGHLGFFCSILKRYSDLELNRWWMLRTTLFINYLQLSKWACSLWHMTVYFVKKYYMSQIIETKCLLHKKRHPRDNLYTISKNMSNGKRPIIWHTVTNNQVAMCWSRMSNTTSNYDLLLIAVAIAGCRFMNA